ncbi:MAG: fibronectin type III domain-containing protein, partial [Oscillospiraceae bacterium]|nr:fibronectin type III domain-containing protein [Oscillospiraceae bacterium]
MKNIIKKRELKRKVAFLMALSMVFSFSDAVSTGASFSNIGIESSKNENGGEETPDNGEEKTPDNGDEETPDNGDEETPDENENNGNNGNDGDAETSETDVDLVSGAGKIDVAIGTALFLNNNINFTVTLTNSQGDTQTRNIDLENFVENKTSFDNLESGIYTLEISASGFVTYTQEINVAQKGYLVKLTAGFCEGLTYSEGGLHPGVLLIGDVDGNGNVDDEDIDILVDAIDGRNVSDDYATDLNHDGETDLVDLMFLTKSYNENKDTQASIEEFVSPAVIKAKVPEGTHAEGDVEKMLKGEDKVTLTPAKEGPISESNPVSLSFDFASSDEVDENGEKKSNVVDGISFSTGSDNPVSEGLIDVTYTEDGQDYTVAVPVKDGVHYLLQESDVYAEVDANGNIQVHLGNQVAVKTVTITIFGMKKNNNLAEISKTQFVNGMESRIPQPEMDIPKDLTADAGSEKFVVSWKPCKNVTSYEVKIQKGNDVETIITEVNSITVSSFKGDDVKNYTTYTVSVQSINGTWKSGYCDSVNVTPKPNKRPDKPDNVKASGIYKGVNVTWANMDDTQSYNVFYKERNSDEEYKKVSGITGTKYTINDLKTITEYEVYVTGSNELGDSPESLHATATTTDLNPAQMPKYNLINRDENGVPGRSHIVSVKRNGGSMVDSKLDADSNDTAWGAVDNDAASYYSKTTWDDGGFNYLNYNDQTGTGNGLVYTFDDFYKMDTISLLVSKGADPFYAKVRYWTEDGKNYVVGASINTMKDSEGRVYYTLKLPNAVTTNKVQIGLGRYWWTSEYNLVTIAETYFYTYDELMDEVMDLYVDNLHTVLKDNVTQKTIDDLREKVNTPDEFGEINPNTAALLRELETAEKILNAESISSPITIHNGITTKDTDRGFSGLNAWQPLGVSVGTGEEVTIYVGNDKKKSGDGTDLRLIATQYHSESGGVTLDGANLKVGANTFTLKKGSAAGFESGGALYIQYQGASNANNTYSVRVTGGSEVPILDLYKVTDEDERMERTVAYVKALDEYVPKMEALHNETHKNSGNKNIDYDYDAKNCILGASDIVLDTMMYSLPAQQILAGAGNGSAEERAETILKSMKSTEDMMYLFYQHK